MSQRNGRSGQKKEVLIVVLSCAVHGKSPAALFEVSHRHPLNPEQIVGSQCFPPTHPSILAQDNRTIVSFNGMATRWHFHGSSLVMFCLKVLSMFLEQQNVKVATRSSRVTTVRCCIGSDDAKFL